MVQIIGQLTKVVLAASLLNGCLSKRFTGETPQNALTQSVGCGRKMKKPALPSFIALGYGPSVALGRFAPMPAGAASPGRGGLAGALGRSRHGALCAQLARAPACGAGEHGAPRVDELRPVLRRGQGLAGRGWGGGELDEVGAAAETSRTGRGGGGGSAGGKQDEAPCGMSSGLRARGPAEWIRKRWRRGEKREKKKGILVISYSSPSEETVVPNSRSSIFYN